MTLYVLYFHVKHFLLVESNKDLKTAEERCFFDVARIVKEKRPMVVFLENVKQFAIHDGGKTLNVLRNTMNELGYSFQYSVLNTVDYGVPQKRERIYMICFRNDINREVFTFPRPFKYI